MFSGKALGSMAGTLIWMPGAPGNRTLCCDLLAACIACSGHGVGSVCRLVTEYRYFYGPVGVSAELRIGDQFTISAWQKASVGRQPSGSLLRKVPSNNRSRTCWSARIEGVWHYGDHDAGLLENAPVTTFRPASPNVVPESGTPPPWGWLTVRYAGGGGGGVTNSPKCAPGKNRNIFARRLRACVAKISSGQLASQGPFGPRLGISPAHPSLTHDFKCTLPPFLSKLDPLKFAPLEPTAPPPPAHFLSVYFFSMLCHGVLPGPIGGRRY